MNVILLLAIVAFLASAIWAAIQRAWPIALLAAGLCFLALADSGILAR
ncbi:hypothetical protein ACIBCT_21160 [Streptosporangium sp. NPDC050855]